ncbi:MAG: hypothetical protein SFU85_13915 [Candidatus Methylacidiphilales bacterium]|nr:hypothetical protein [Candidatus Methylacidiphilales bacterium]
MESGPQPTASEVYARYRAFSRERLREESIPRFNRLEGRQRLAEVGLVRAVGAVFGEHGTTAEKKEAAAWLLGLLTDPEEKIRRYAINALPKLRPGPEAESALLRLLETSASERETTAVREALHKIGGTATLHAMGDSAPVRVRANIARQEHPGGVVMDRNLADFRSLRIHLRGRRGLARFVCEELQDQVRTRGRFQIIDQDKGLVALRPLSPFSLGDLTSLRCTGSVGFVLGLVKEKTGAPRMEALARAIASPLTRRILAAFHDGPPRYRLAFIDDKAESSHVPEIAARAYALHPGLLNDSQQAPWAMDVHETRVGASLELRPRFSPDPRFAYRLHDVAAASHPPLAASLARWAGRPGKPERVWDPFCGSGLELIESGLLGGVSELHGSDLSGEALVHARANLAAAGLVGIRTHFNCCDFRDYPKKAGIPPGSLTLVISNPPLGRRIRIPNLRGLIHDLFLAADRVLAPGGRLIFTNPVKIDCPVPSLHLEERLVADLGGFDCRLEKYVKAGLSNRMAHLP